MPGRDYERWLAHVDASAPPLGAAAYAELFRKSLPPQPLVYASPPPGLFQHIITQVQEPAP